MTVPIWSDLCKHPNLTASTEKYAKLVYDSTTELHQPVQSILSALDRRAIGLTKCANFESALRDAKAMQQLSPASALGYAREAIINREQGKQLQVIDICNQGLTLADTMDTHYDTLKRLKQDAEQRQDTRIDFIQQLPLDIVTTTLVPMLMDDDYMDALQPSPSLFVSRLWRDRILQSYGGLRFKIGSEEDIDLAKAIELTEHVKALHIEQYTKGTWLGDLIRDNDFSSLRELDIRSFQTVHISHFLLSLKSISSTLTELSIDLEASELLLSIPDVLLACPNLTSLRILQCSDNDVSSLPITPWPTLTTLSLSSAMDVITCDQIIEMWKRFPSLTSLDLHPCSDIQSALVVSDYFPTMKSLHLFMELSDIRLIYSDDGNRNQETGITKLIIENDDWPRGICRDTTSILNRHHDTLEHLKWDMDTSGDTETIGNIQFPRLTKLGLSCSGWQIIHNAPMLEELKLALRIIIRHPRVLDTIPPHLKSLELDLVGMRKNVDRSPILRYLNRIALQSQLKELVIHFSTGDEVDGILDAIYRHGQLECLKIIFTKAWESCQMERFLDGLVKVCPRLSSLVLGRKNAPSTHSLNILKRLAYLNKLDISVYRTGDIDSFWDAIRTFSQPMTITMRSSSDAEQSRIKYLKLKRPDMKINANRYSLYHK